MEGERRTRVSLESTRINRGRRTDREVPWGFGTRRGQDDGSVRLQYMTEGPVVLTGSPE